MAGRTMINQINTPTKYALVQGNGSKATGLFASYNRSIQKTAHNQGNKSDNGYSKEGYSKIHEKSRNMNITQDPSLKKEIVDIRVRSSSSSKKYRYVNDIGHSSPKVRAGCKKKVQYKGNYGDHHAVERKDSALQSVMDRNMMLIKTDPSYANVKNTIASTSSKKNSNNTSRLVSTSSRNASITPRKVSTKAKMNASPE